MKLTRYIAPFDCKDVLQLWGEIFGEAEAALEKPQIDGSEISENLDIVYVATEGNALLGAIHATIPHICPSMCGLSGMCTTKASRGKGLGKILFTKILEEIDQRGVETTFLGTGNPIASKLYHSLGFSFLPGSYVMVRYSKGDTVDFTRRNYNSVPKVISVVSDTPSMRIPLIPLVLHRGQYKLLDYNTKILSSEEMVQLSCMGLYPRYAALQKQGGHFWGATNENGVLGAVASAAVTEQGIRADFFCCDSFSIAIPELLDKCGRTLGTFYLHLAKMDTEKRLLAESMGFKVEAESDLQIGSYSLPGLIYQKD